MDKYKVGSRVHLAKWITADKTKSGSDMRRIATQGRKGTVRYFFGTALPWKDRIVTVVFPAKNGRQKDIILHDKPVDYFEEVK